MAIHSDIFGCPYLTYGGWSLLSFDLIHTEPQMEPPHCHLSSLDMSAKDLLTGLPLYSLHFIGQIMYIKEERERVDPDEIYVL